MSKTSQELLEIPVTQLWNRSGQANDSCRTMHYRHPTEVDEQPNAVQQKCWLSSLSVHLLLAAVCYINRDYHECLRHFCNTKLHSLTVAWPTNLPVVECHWRVSNSTLRSETYWWLIWLYCGKNKQPIGISVQVHGWYTTNVLATYFHYVHSTKGMSALEQWRLHYWGEGEKATEQTKTAKAELLGESVGRAKSDCSVSLDKHPTGWLTLQKSTKYPQWGLPCDWGEHERDPH
jgi:hypothetical protein